MDKTVEVYMSITQFEISIDKLSILYMIKTVKSFVTNTGLCDFFVTKSFIDYFTLQAHLDDLEKDGYIYSKKVDSKALYFISEKGEETLNVLISQVPETMLLDMDDYIVNTLNSAKNYDTLTDISSNANDEFIVSLSAFERGENIINIKLNVPTKEIAIDMCNRWELKNVKIYELIYKTLLGK